MSQESFDTLRNSHKVTYATLSIVWSDKVNAREETRVSSNLLNLLTSLVLLRILYSVFMVKGHPNLPRQKSFSPFGDYIYGLTGCRTFK